jgi:uncharacterized oligopeptide transporter (OPT) family protein
MYFPLALLNTAFGFGTRQLAAPQAGLMAALAQGIVGGNMAWPLVGVGILFGIAMIMVQVSSPMLVAVGMYLPFETTFAIFVGGVIRLLADQVAKNKGLNNAQRARVDNAGVLTASGLIAGESVFGLFWAALVALSLAQRGWWHTVASWASEVASTTIFKHPGYGVGALVMILLAALMILLPLTAAGDPSEPAPPAAMM